MADIVIRGMGIPKEPTNITIYPDGCWCDYTSNDSHGKFIVLPEGHGRLIDADELMNRARGCLDELTMLSLEFLVNGSNTIVPEEGGGKDV